MGDLRNKARKEAEEALIRARQATRDAARPKPILPRCACGLNHYEVPIMWTVQGADRWAPTAYYCPACLPANLIRVVAHQIANLRDDS